MAHEIRLALLFCTLSLGTVLCSETFPRVVKVQLELDDVMFIDDRSERFGLKFKMLSEWAKLTNASTGVFQDFEPELFLDTEENLDSIRSFTQTTIDGRVQQLRVLTSTFFCHMEFSWFPIDEQKCTITIRSRVYDKNDLILSWIDEVEEPLSGAGANFTVRRIEQSSDEECLQSADSTDYSCLRLTIIFLRAYKPYLISFILPTAVICIVSWLTLFVRSSNLRGLMTALTMFATGASTYITYLKLPCPGCVKFLDIWTLLVCGMVSICFLEFVVVQFAFKRVVSGRKRYTINDLKPNCVDSFFRVVLGVLMSFSMTFYLTYIYVVINGRNNVF